MFEMALLKYAFMSVFCVSFIKRVFLKLSMPPWRLLMKKLYDSVLWIGINNLRSSWHSFDRPQKDERLSRPWNHPVFLNLEPLGWGPALNTRPLLDPSIIGILTFTSNKTITPSKLDWKNGFGYKLKCQ